MHLLISHTNDYGKKLQFSNRPHRKNSRSAVFKETNIEEIRQFIVLCLLQEQVRFHVLRKMFSYDPLSYQPVFLNTMLGRRFEQLIRCYNCTNERQRRPSEQN